MSCAHSFGEWCSECIAGMVDQFNQCRRHNATLSAHVETLEREKAELTDEAIQKHGMDSGFWGRAASRALTAKKQAEQQRDAAHAALWKYGQHLPSCGKNPSVSFICQCGLDAALAASAPQKRRVGCERADGMLNIHAESETCEICAPAQETER